MSNRPSTPALALARRAWRQLHADAGLSLHLSERALTRARADQDALGLAWAQLTQGFHRLYFAAPAQAEQVLTQAAQAFALLRAREGEILALAGCARALWRQGRVLQALDLLLPLRDEGLQLLRNEQRGVLLNAIAGCYSAQGQSEQAFAYMYQALRDAGPKRGQGFDTALHCNLAHELIELGDFHEALRQVERGLERMVGVAHGRMHTVLLVNRVIALTELGRAEQALPDIRAIGAAQPDPSGRGLVPMHFEALALGALRAGDDALAQALMARVDPARQLPDDRIELALARALAAKLAGRSAQGLLELAQVATQLDAEGDARPSLRMRCNHATLEAELQESEGDAGAALRSLHWAQGLQAERARLASAARYQAAMLQTELLALQQRLEDQESKRLAAERARTLLAEANERLSRKMAEVEALQAQLRAQATQDVLTGLANRRQLNDSLPALLAMALREGSPLAVVVIDLDHFKRVNDEHGHPMGDQILAGLGQLLRDHLRRSDQAFRYGGEEFCLLMPGTSAGDAQLKVQQLLAAWKLQVFALDGGGQLAGLSFSAGVTDSTLTAPSPSALLRGADQLLLLAKRAQRGTVLVPGIPANC